MGTQRYAGGNTYLTLKQDLITQAKRRAHELGGNAIVECKMAISREMAYGQWGNLAGYIYGTAVHYTLNPPDTRTSQEIQKKQLIPTKTPKIKTRKMKRINQMIQPINDE